MSKPALRVVEDSESESDDSKSATLSYSSVYGFEALDRLMITGGEILRDSYVNRILTALIIGSKIPEDCIGFMMSEAEHQLELEPDNETLVKAVEEGHESVAVYLKKRLYPPGKGAQRRLLREIDK